MAIKAYKKLNSEGKEETFYQVTAEALNRYTGLRIQKSRRGISSLPKAERIYRELWGVCRESRPDGADLIKNWKLLVRKYIFTLDANTRSVENPNGYSPAGIDTKVSRLNHLKTWEEMHLDLITHAFVTREIDEFERKGMSRAMANHLIKEIKRIFNFAVELGALKSNPLATLRRRRAVKRRKEALTHSEADFLLAEAKKRNHPYYFIWLLTLALGLRRSELAGLKWMDVDFEHRLIYLRRQKIPFEGEVPFLKDKEERTVAIPLGIIPQLKKMKLMAQTDYVIEVKCSFWECGLQAAVLREFCREIGIKEVTHHQLRATHITLALIDGIPLGIVKENVGHAKLSTTDEYFRSAGIEMKGQTDGLKLKVPLDEEAQVLILKR